jgi:hypothetical protein
MFTSFESAYGIDLEISDGCVSNLEGFNHSGKRSPIKSNGFGIVWLVFRQSDVPHVEIFLLE